MRGRFRASIGSLMGLVLFVAVGLAALKSPSELWAGIMFGLCLVILASAAVLAVARRGRSRAAWAGMASFGLVYIHAVFGGEVPYPPIPTTALLDRLAAAVPGWDNQRTWLHGTAGGSGSSGLSITTVANGRARYVPAGHFDLLAYRQIGHSLLTIIFGAVGAVFGMMVRAERAIADLSPR